MDCMPLLLFHPYMRHLAIASAVFHPHSPTIFNGRSKPRNQRNLTLVYFGHVWFSSGGWLACALWHWLWIGKNVWGSVLSALAFVFWDLQGSANGMQCSNHSWEALPQLATTAWSFHARPSRGGHELAIKSNKTHQISPRRGMIWNGLGPTIWLGRWNSLDKNIYFVISEWFLQGVCRASSWSSSLKASSFVPGCSFSNFSVAHMARYSTISAVSAVSESHWVSDMLR